MEVALTHSRAAIPSPKVAHTIHAIRHTIASEIGASGDDADVMAITGHTTSVMVQHYAGAAPQRARAEKVQKGRT